MEAERETAGPSTDGTADPAGRGENAMTKRRPDYPYLRAWSRMMGLKPDFIETQVERARASRAPQTAVYERTYQEGTAFGGPAWVDFSEITRADTRATIERIVREDRGE